MDIVSKQILGGVCLNLFAQAARQAIPLLKEEHEEIHRALAYARTYSGEPELVALLEIKERELTEAILGLEIALKEAGPLVKPAVRVVDHLDGDPRNYERSNLLIMVQR